MRFVDFLLCLGLFIMAGFIFRFDLIDFRELKKQNVKASTTFDSPVPLLFVYGYDDHGQFISKLPLERKRLAIFVIHGDRFEEEAGLWNSIAAHYDSAELGFAGVCGDSACIEHLSQVRGKLGFSSFIYGDYLAMRTLMKTDDEGQMEILERATSTVRTVPRPRTLKDFEEIKTHITEVR
jgi:hypothetical protein